MRSTHDQLRMLLRCPTCQAPLDWVEERVRCGNLDCGHHERGFSLINGQPVLIDFESCILPEDEVVAHSQATKPLRSDSRVGMWVRNRLFRGDANRRAQEQVEAFLEQLRSTTANPTVLVIGGRTNGMGVQTLYESSDVNLVNFDICGSRHTDFVADGHRIPMADASVDGVWIQYVLEHVLEPQRVVDEIHRVLGPDGLVYSETPFMQQVHAGPADFVRFSHSGHRWLFRWFNEIDSGVAMGPGVQLLWTIENFARGVLRSKRGGQIVKLSLFWLRYLDRLIGDSYRIDNASSVYFLGKKSDSPLPAREMLGYYRGGLGEA